MFLCTIMYYTSTNAAFVFYGTWTMSNGFIFLTVQHDTAWFCCCFISRFFVCFLFFTIGLILIMAIQNVFISFSSPYFLNGVDWFFTNKQTWPRAISFLIFSWPQIWVACDILRKSSAGGRRWSFWQTTTFLFAVLSTIARWYFLPKNYACFSFFSPISEIIKKLFCSFLYILKNKSWTKPIWPSVCFRTTIVKQS